MKAQININTWCAGCSIPPRLLYNRLHLTSSAPSLWMHKPRAKTVPHLWAVATVSPAIPPGKGHHGWARGSQPQFAALTFSTAARPTENAATSFDHCKTLAFSWKFSFLSVQEHAYQWFLFLVQDFYFCFTSILILCCLLQKHFASLR